MRLAKVRIAKHPGVLFAVVAVGWLGCSFASADDADSLADQEPPRLSELLPPRLADRLDVNAWGWLSDLYSSADHHNYWDADVALGATARVTDRLAATADIHFFDADNAKRGFLEQAFVSTRLFDPSDAVLTVGKFNAGISLEPRNAWDRLGGTSGLLFGAMPQDAIGIMYTQPLGESSVKVMPFLTNGFEGSINFDQPPAGGVTIQYRASDTLSFAITNWFGGGFRPEDDDDDGSTEIEESSRRHSADEYAAGTDEYADNAYAYSYGNWVGPQLHGDHAGFLYLLDPNLTWTPGKNVKLEIEGLLAIDTAAGGISWGGATAVANYDINDRFRVFARYSYLDDVNGIITAVESRDHEFSVGGGYGFVPGAELRLEYRHDLSETRADLDAVSIHLTFGY